MYEQFKTRAEAVSAVVHRFATRDEAMAFIGQFLLDEGVADQTGRYAVWAGCPFLAETDREPLARVTGLKFDVTRQLAAEAHVGISQVDWALADIGTLVQDATAIDKRLVSTLPWIHIALIATEGLRADDLDISTAYVDEGVTLRRIRPRAKGSASRILKRGSHITVVVEPKGTKGA